VFWKEPKKDVEMTTLVLAIYAVGLLLIVLVVVVLLIVAVMSLSKLLWVPFNAKTGATVLNLWCLNNY